MSRRLRPNSIPARTLAAAVWGAVSALILAPPFLVSLGCNVAAAAIYLSFSFICHQSPGRVFTIFDIPLAVCHRCCGIYWGLFLGSFLPSRWIHRSPGARRAWMLAAVAPLLFDALAPFCGVWTNTALTRLLTGLAFGVVTSCMLTQGISEFIAEAPWRRSAGCAPRLQGGLS